MGNTFGCWAKIRPLSGERTELYGYPDDHQYGGLGILWNCGDDPAVYYFIRQFLNGSHYLYPVIAAACMGGISFFKRQGKVSGAWIGTLSAVMFMHIIVILGIQSSFETILEGLIIIISILFNNGDCKQLKIVPLNLKIPH